jgi:tetratricopeptide (TPR) repeat protein
VNKPRSSRRIPHLLALLLTTQLLTFSPAMAGSTPATATKKPEKANQALLEGIHLLYNMHYDEAEALFRELAIRSPDDPASFFYLAMVTWCRLVSGFWTPDEVKAYSDRIDRTVEVARKRVSKGVAGAYDYLYLGGALGFKGRFELMEGNWLRSFFLALDAIDALKTCQRMDPENRDVLLGLGIFDYYTAHLSGVLKFLSYLLIHPGDKKEGLKKLTLAAEEATYSATEAKSVLLHNYLFLEQDFKKAMDLADQLTRQYPRDYWYWMLLGVCQVRLQMEKETQITVDFLRDRSKDPAFTPQEQAVWLRRSIYLAGIRDAYAEDWKGARAKFRALLGDPDPIHDPAMIAWPLLKIAMCYDLEQEHEKAKKIYQQILEMENGAGAQFLAKKYLVGAPPSVGDPFLGY